MIKKIIIPTDGYGLEDHVIWYVARAFPFAEFYIISVINTYEREVQLTTLLYKEIKESAVKAVKEGKDILEGEEITNVKTRVLEGLPSKKIVEYAKKKDADLVAMRVYSRKATASAQRLGSAVKNVIKRSNIPVLTLAEECDPFPIKNVLLSTDETGKPERAKNFAILFSSYFKVNLEGVHTRLEELDQKVKKTVETGRGDNK